MRLKIEREIELEAIDRPSKEMYAQDIVDIRQPLLNEGLFPDVVRVWSIRNAIEDHFSEKEMEIRRVPYIRERTLSIKFLGTWWVDSGVDTPDKFIAYCRCMCGNGFLEKSDSVYCPVCGVSHPKD